MEPSPDGIMKVVNEFEGYTRSAVCRPFGLDHDIELSVPRSHALNPTDTIPSEGREAIEKVIQICLPAFAGRQLFDTAICWCTDSFDGNWLLCEHPRYKNLILATGDSGHTFKMLPIVGKYVVGLIEGTVSGSITYESGEADIEQLSDEDKRLWRWRPQENRPGLTGREGTRPKDLSTVGGWCHDKPPPEQN